jgi:HSP20 family protein
MGIIDKVAAVLPWRGERHEPQRADVLTLRDDFERWLEPFFDDTRHLLPVMSDFPWTPSTDMQETDDELMVTMEVPGLDGDDLDLRLTPQGLTIRGEKREAKETKRKGYELVERRYGSFVRSVPLPPGLDLDRAEARVKRGVLTVTIPKAAAFADMRRIPISA